MALATPPPPVSEAPSLAGERFYRPELDCLRFFAFFGVFLFHTPGGDTAYYAARHVPCPALVASVISAGRFGVDLFFLLSAYLITELLMRERDRFGKIALRAFYVRRILRIWPLYFLGLLIAVVLGAVSPTDEYFPIRYATAFVCMLGNWLVFFGARLQSVMSPLWSVSFEEQFYLIWPSFMAKTPSVRSLKRAAVFLLALATVARILMAGHARAMGAPAAIFQNSLARLDPIAVGILTAVLLHGRRLEMSGRARLGLLVCGLAICIAAGHFYGLSTAFLLFGYPAVALGTWLILRSAVGIAFAPGWLRYLGKISYGLYVFHELALYCSMKLLGEGVHSLRVFAIYWSLGLSLTVLMAAVSYRWFESPFLGLKEKFARVKSRPV